MSSALRALAQFRAYSGLRPSKSPSATIPRPSAFSVALEQHHKSMESHLEVHRNIRYSAFSTPNTATRCTHSGYQRKKLESNDLLRLASLRASIRYVLFQDCYVALRSALASPLAALAPKPTLHSALPNLQTPLHSTPLRSVPFRSVLRSCKT